MASPSTPEAVSALRDELDRKGCRLVFTNGCFDILHAGHVRYLNQARQLGDAMVVALNSDVSARALKGPGRPINNEIDRAEVLLGLKAVDAVVVYDEERCTRLIRAIRPHLYAKGGDYTPESLNREEKAALDEVGAAIHILSLVPGKSTSGTIAKLKAERESAEIRRVRLGVVGSGRGSNLEAIIAAIADGTLAADIAIVISDVKGARILEIARAAGLPAVFVDPGPFKTRFGDSAQLELCARLSSAKVDLVILAGFMRRVKEPLLSTFAGRILNVHPSLLPAFPGLSAWRQALEAGAAETGTTVHVVDASLDAGAILAQQSVPVLPGDTPQELLARIQAVEHQLYPRAIAAYARKILHESA
jgi:formyltetrahydrofolate-dependent phosphoribosylglycinamide formyltransferase